jgi:hypothetical protein
VRKLPLAWQPQRNEKSMEPALAGNGICQNIGRFDVFVDNPTLMQVIERTRKTDRQTQP